MTDFEKVAQALLTLAREQPGQPMRHNFIDRTYDGLKMVIKLDGEMWTLGLWRQSAFPDTPEIDAARQALDVPKGTVAIPKIQKTEKTGETWRGVILSWHQPVAMTVVATTVREFIAR